MLRQLVHLLDDAIPIIAGSEVNDHPFAPVSRYARDLIADQGDRTPVEWIGRDRRYQEKLATPDVTIADLIGEVDMIKHAEGRYLSSELTMHFGLIPRTNRGIFCINELPDLAPKIQVGLFNVLEERDIQIRGYPVRLDLDVCMVFSANPEDYTNRGRIVTPLKDRIGSVVRTHYPLTREIGIAISDQNAWLERGGNGCLPGHPAVRQGDGRGSGTAGAIVAARESAIGCLGADVDREPGECGLNAERRAIINRERWIVPRISDLTRPRPAAGKLELTMSEDDGHEDKLIHRIIGEATKNIFGLHVDVRELRPVVDYFESGHARGRRSVAGSHAARAHRQGPGLRKRAEELAAKATPDVSDRDAREAAIASAAEFLLEGLHVHNKLNKSAKERGELPAVSGGSFLEPTPNWKLIEFPRAGHGTLRIHQMGRLSAFPPPVGRQGLRPALRILMQYGERSPAEHG